MLDSRYVHLHEALGLGAMWLKQSAKIIKQPETLSSSGLTGVGRAGKVAPVGNWGESVPQQSPNHKTNHNPNQAKNPMNAGRLACLARLKLDKKNHTEPQNPAQTKPAFPTELSSSSVSYQWNQTPDGVVKAKVMVLTMCASLADVATGKLLSGEDGILLNKMLAAINLSESDVYLNAWLKDLPNFESRPPTEWVQAAAPRVLKEAELSGATVWLLMGHFFERPDVQVYFPKENKGLFFIPHPQRILSNPKLKRGAWETLQKLRDYLHDER